MEITIEINGKQYVIKDLGGKAWAVMRDSKLLAYYDESDPEPFIAAIGKVLLVMDQALHANLGVKIVGKACGMVNIA